MKTHHYSLVIAALITCVTTARGASLEAAEQAQRARALCRANEGVDQAVQAQRAGAGLALAEAAVAADDTSAVAHFAVFCNLGRQMQLEGFGLRSLGKLRRLMREVDRALELDPASVDALVGKAGVLLELPRFLGGDAVAAERLVRRALALDPAHGEARFYLARARAARGLRTDDAEAMLSAARSPSQPDAALFAAAGH